MLDIKKAIEIENDYIENRMNDVDDCLIDRLSALDGFVDLDDYFNQKREYLIREQHCKIITVPTLDILDTFHQLINETYPVLMVQPSDREYIVHGTEDYNQDFCKEKNFYICEVGHRGGNLVVGKDDVAFGIMMDSHITDISVDWILEGYRDIFIKYGYNAVVDNNDVLIDGIKILGGAFFENGDRLIHVCNVSFTDTTELIQAVCLKERIKTPGFVHPPLTREILIEEVKEWLQAQ